MYENFDAAFNVDSFVSDAIGTSNSFLDDPALTELLRIYGGCSFNQGLYRVARTGEINAWNDLVTDAFPVFKGIVTCFSADWLGRVFAVDPRRTEAGQSGVLMFEPGTGEVLEIPCNIQSFHNSELINYRDAALAEGFHRQWLSSGGSAPNRDQCIGYKKPLFLGGEDKITNLEVSDFEVYWVITAQLLRKTEGRSQGDSVLKVTIS